MRIGVADLNQVLVSTGLGHRGIVERLDDLLADFARLETVSSEY